MSELVPHKSSLDLPDQSDENMIPQKFEHMLAFCNYPVKLEDNNKEEQLKQQKKYQQN